jgi:hypothetical protein
VYRINIQAEKVECERYEWFVIFRVSREKRSSINIPGNWLNSTGTQAWRGKTGKPK